MKRLKSLDVNEVSLVDIGANKKKFLVFKSKLGATKMDFKKIAKSLRIKKEAGEDEKEAMKKAQEKEAEEKEAAKKAASEGGSLSEGAQAALKAIGRILTPFKDEISDSDVDAVLEELGIEFPASEMEKEKGEEGEKDELQKLFAIPEEVKEEHAIEALNKAKEAMGECLKEKGYGKEEAERSKGEDEVEKSKYAEIFKSHKELVQKNASLEKTINEMKSKEVEKEIVQKSASFTHLGINKDELVEVLKAAKSVSEKHYEVVCKQYSALNEQAKKSNLFGEVGSRLGNAGMSDAEAKIDAAVKSIVQKSSGVTEAQAYDSFMKTSEGKALYGEMKAARPHGI